MKMSVGFSVIVSLMLSVLVAEASGTEIAFCKMPNFPAGNHQTEVMNKCREACIEAANWAKILTETHGKSGGMVDNFKKGRDIMNKNVHMISKNLKACESAAKGEKADSKNEFVTGGSVIHGGVALPEADTKGYVARHPACGVKSPNASVEINAQEPCDKYVSKIIEGLSKDAAEAADLARQYKAGLNKAMMITGGAVAIGAGAMIYDDHKDDKKKKKAQQEYDLGIIKQADGKKIDCITASNYMSLDCRATLTRVCQEDEPKNPNTPNACRSFNAQYCAGEGSDTNYCLMQTAKAYCGTNTSSPSPACQWNAKRDASCKADPEKGSCLFSGTSDALKLQCGKYPNDPLCLAHANGRIVIAGGNAAAEAGGSSTTYSDIVGEASSSSTSSDDLLPPNANLWASGSVQIQQNCAAGNLAGCQ